MKIRVLSSLFFFIFFCSLALATSCNYQQYGDTECARPPDNNYCIMYQCQIYSGPTELFCTDPDGNNSWTAAAVSSRYRDYDGTFRELGNSDSCLQGNTLVETCLPGYDCKVFEWTCGSGEIGSPMQSGEIPCPGGCSSGKCTDAAEPDSSVSTNGLFNSSTFPGSVFGTATDGTGSGIQKVEVKIKKDANNWYWNGGSWGTSETWLLASGTTAWSYSFSSSNLTDGMYSVYSRATDNAQNAEASMGYNYFIFQGPVGVIGTPCNFAANGDTECDAVHQIYCMNGVCAPFSDSVLSACTDTDNADLFVRGTLSYRYRNLDGQVFSGVILDECSYVGSPVISCGQGSSCNVKELSCKTGFFSNANFDFNYFSCANGCTNGACLALQSGTPDQNTADDSNDLDTNSIHSVTDSELLQYIEQWSTGSLKSDEAENDLAIQQIVAVWKETADSEPN